MYEMDVDIQGHDEKCARLWGGGPSSSVVGGRSMLFVSRLCVAGRCSWSVGCSRWSLVGGCFSLVVGSSTLAIGFIGCRFFSWVVDRGMSSVSWRVLNVGAVQLVIYRW